MDSTNPNQPLNFKIEPIDETKEVDHQYKNNTFINRENNDYIITTDGSDEENDDKDNIKIKIKMGACYQCYKQCVDKCCRKECLHYVCDDHLRIATDSHFILCCKYNEDDVFCEKCGKEYKQLSLTCLCIIIALFFVFIILIIVYI